MATNRWDFWADRLQRETVAVALVLTTTLGGWSTQQAAASTSTSTSASEPRPVPTAPRAAAVTEVANPVEAVYSFKDALQAVAYQLEFEPAGRDQTRLLEGCATVRREAASLRGALEKLDEAFGALEGLAGPTIEACAHPAAIGAGEAEAALAGYVQFRELAFDVSS